MSETECPQCGRPAHPELIETAEHLVGFAACCDENGTEGVLIDGDRDVWRIEFHPVLDEATLGVTDVEPQTICLSASDEDGAICWWAYSTDQGLAEGYGPWRVLDGPGSVVDGWARKIADQRAMDAAEILRQMQATGGVS